MVIAAGVALVLTAVCAAWVAGTRRAQDRMLAAGELYRGGHERLEAALEQSRWVEKVGIGMGLLAVLFSGVAYGEPLATFLVVLADVLAVTLIALRTQASRKGQDVAVREALERIARS
jgi:hypothetical protein